MRILTHRVAATAAAGLALFAFAACSSSDDPGVASLSSSSASASSSSQAGSEDPEDQAMAFVQCMRENGIDVPDPDSSGMIMLGDENTDPEQLTAAQEACKDKMPGGTTDGFDAGGQEALLAYAACMREHGVDMPDPGADGSFQITMPEGPDAEQAYGEANKICAAELGGLGGGDE